LRKFHNGELHNLYSSPDIIRQINSRRMKWAGHVARMGEGRNVYRVLVGKPEGKRPLVRPRHRWQDGIKMDLRKIGWGCGVDSSGSVQEQLAGSFEYSDESSGSGAIELFWWMGNESVSDRSSTQKQSHPFVAITSRWRLVTAFISPVHAFGCFARNGLKNKLRY
jgi:hypothetical protein